MKWTGAKIVVEILLEQGVDTVFGFPGSNVLDIYDELYRQRKRIRHILTAHEQGAAHAADGYARVSGKPGVVLATSGPGATNLITGIANAYLDSTPMIVLTGNVPTSKIGSDSFQEVSTMDITMPITKHNYMVKDVRQLADILRRAFVIATSDRPGPVLIDLPKDVQQAVVGAYAPDPSERAQLAPLPSGTDWELTQVAAMIRSACRPMLYVGGGCLLSHAAKEVCALSDLLHAPVATSLMGVTVMPYSHENYVGISGTCGRRMHQTLQREADLILALGVRFSDRALADWESNAPNAKIVQIDIDPCEINKNIRTSLGVIADVRLFLQRLLTELYHSPLPAHYAAEWHASFLHRKQDQLLTNAAQGCDGLSPRSVFQMLQHYTGQDTVIATDVGLHQMWTARYYHFETPSTLVTSGGLGAMGFGLGAAIGAAIAGATAGKPKRVVLITGDGSFGMNLTELATAVTYQIPLVIVVFNNQSLGMVRQWQTVLYHRRYSETTLRRKTDFAQLAKAFGAEGATAGNLDECKAALDKAFAVSAPFVVDVRISPDEIVPMQI